MKSRTLKSYVSQPAASLTASILCARFKNRYLLTTCINCHGTSASSPEVSRYKLDACQALDHETFSQNLINLNKEKAEELLIQLRD